MVKERDMRTGRSDTGKLRAGCGLESDVKGQTVDSQKPSSRDRPPCGELGLRRAGTHSGSCGMQRASDPKVGSWWGKGTMEARMSSACEGSRPLSQAAKGNRTRADDKLDPRERKADALSTSRGPGTVTGFSHKFCQMTSKHSSEKANITLILREILSFSCFHKARYWWIQASDPGLLKVMIWCF